MVERLSSLQTFGSKFIVPLVWFCAFGLIMVINAADPKTWPAMLASFIAGTGFICWSCVRLKKVSIDDYNLYVSNYLQEIAVPFSFIGDVTSHRWVNHNLATIHFKSTTEFGDHIVFIPPYRFMPFVGPHPVVTRLKHLTMIS
jgi:hypothetical protein